MSSPKPPSSPAPRCRKRAQRAAARVAVIAEADERPYNSPDGLLGAPSPRTTFRASEKSAVDTPFSYSTGIRVSTLATPFNSAAGGRC